MNNFDYNSVTYFVAFVVFIYGILIGSFLNVLIYRIPKKMNLVYSRSICTNCKHVLGVFDLFPLFSYLFLRGKCRYCKVKISFIYPFVEFLNGISYFFVYLLFGLNIYSVFMMLFLSFVIVVFFIKLNK